MSIRSGAAVVPAAVALCCLGLTACTGSAEAGHPFASGKTGRSPAADVATGRPAEHIEAEAVTAAPKLPSGERLAQVAAARGNRRIELGRIHAGGLAVSVSCQGKGTLTVKVEPRSLRIT
ncbi:hypothetical protein [Streptomyces sp. NPDC014006]|uniref:hypothetical protein n=1 Tax=Streptomyces sp. NPDC014006 TaxID=3364870 RepID=UPI0036F7B259